jgi:chorismate mutase/prephenate dehydratase
MLRARKKRFNCNHLAAWKSMSKTPADKQATLAEARTRIDSIDQQLQSLISERARWAQQVGRAKGPRKAAVDYFRPEREAQVLRGVIDRNDGPLPHAELVRLFREIMSSCLSQQQPLKIGFLGPEGTFSEQAVRKHFGHAAYGLPLGSIEEVFQEVAAGNADFGVVPVENSGQGMIQMTLDMFLVSKATICGEVELRVHQNLLSLSGELKDVKRVYSHPQSLQQCQGWLRVNLPHVERVPVSSNAEAARTARLSPESAAIAGETAGRVYGLKTVAGPIEDRSDNTTRFLVIGEKTCPPTGNDRTSILFAIHDRPGSLVKALQAFDQFHINMSKIESRPSKRKDWEYIFYVDLAGHCEDGKVADALEELGAHCSLVKLLGSYPDTGE